VPVNAKSFAVTLFIPQLMRFRDDMFRELAPYLPRLPALELILARASQSRTNARDFESTLFELFHLPKPESGDFPIGALTDYLHSGEITQRWYMRADPVYIQPNRDHLLLLGNQMIDIDVDEARRLVDDINKTYIDTPWQLKMVSARQWVIEMEQTVSLQTYAPSEVTGKNINEYLPQGRDAKSWHALLNELQMLLHAHPVNRAREMKGMMSVNSVWFWGAGQLPKFENSSVRQDYVQCWTNHSSVQALSRWFKVPRVDLPDDGVKWLKHAITPGNHLLVIDDLNVPSSLIDPVEWWQCLLRVDQQWLQPLLSALAQGDIAELNLIADSGYRFHLTRSLSKRWWKRIKALI